MPADSAVDLTDRSTVDTEPEELEEAEALVVESLVVEEISIDGMCGVY